MTTTPPPTTSAAEPRALLWTLAMVQASAAISGQRTPPKRTRLHRGARVC